MYSSINFKSKKAFKEHVKAYNEQVAKGVKLDTDDLTAELKGHLRPVTLFAPGLGSPKDNGSETVEGPHYPRPHTWYAQVQVKDGIVVSVK